jgi:hypothetical protein
MKMSEKELNDKAKKIVEIIGNLSIKHANRLINLGRILSKRSKFTSEAHRIASILCHGYERLEDADKDTIIAKARKLRSQWRRA